MIHSKCLANRQALTLCALVFLTFVTATPGAAKGIEGSQILLVPAQFGTIQSAIDAAVDGDTVQVAPGTYTESIDFLGKNITVISESGPASTVIDPSANGRAEVETPPRHFETRRFADGRVEVLGIDGEPWIDAMGIVRVVPPWPEGGLDSVVIFENGEGRDAVLEGFTITGGRADEGGGVRIEGASPTVRGNVITGNLSCRGGSGIAILSASPLIEGNTVTHNDSVGACSGGPGGGGILVQGAGTAEIRGNTVDHNDHCTGGGIRLTDAGAPLLIDNIIHNNSSFNGGGGLDIVNPSDELIVQNLIYGNDGRNGDGVAWIGRSGVKGPRFVNNTIAYNGDVSVYAAGTDGGTTLENNLIVGTPGRTAFACEGLFDFDLPNLDSNNVFTGFGGIAYNFACDDVTGMDGNISADPLFIDPNQANFRLAAGSASVDAADNNAADVPFFDLDGNTRLFDGDGDMLAVIDHGAYEQGSKPPPPADPNTWHVPADFATIQAAIDGAFPGDIVLVSAGTYSEEIDFRGKALHLASVDGPSQTIIGATGGATATNNGSVVAFSTGERRGSVLEGFTLTGGNASNGGGGIYMELASPTIRGNIITGNRACIDGGGIRVINGSPLIEDNVISDNGIMGCSVPRGGGIALEGFSDNDAEIRGNVISGNSAVWGGGIRISGVSGALVIDNRIVGNSATQSGGGMDIINAFEGALIQNRFEGNESANDQGEDLAWDMAGEEWAPRMVNNTVVATGSGPSLLLDGFHSTAEVINNIVLAADGALGIECGDSGDSNPPIFRRNNVFSATGTPYGALCGSPTGTDGNLSQDPRLVDPAGGDLRLRGDSPSIDAGEGGIRDLPPEDFEGDARSLDGDGDGTVTIDQGVDEAPLDTTPPTNPQSLESTSHVPMVWSNLAQIDLQWSGAADDLPLGSGMAGYSVLFDTAVDTEIDDVADLAHGSDPQSTSQSVTDGMQHYVHLRACDLRGNCAATVHLGPFWVDLTPPSGPGDLVSTSHTPNVASPDSTIDLTWNAATDDASGVAGYRWLATQSAMPSCDGGNDLAATGVTTEPLADGSWFVHLCAIDAVDNVSTPVTAGPFLIHQVIFMDGFESGQTDAWSAAMP